MEAINAPQSLVLPVGWFQPSRVIEIYTDAPVRVRLDHILQDGPDFERVSYVLEK